MKANSTPDPASLRQRALGYLARREHSRFDLARKLERAGFTPEAIGPVLDEFETKNWLSDKRFAESWVADHRAKDGNLKLTHALRMYGVADETIEAALLERGNDELNRAKAIWRKKYSKAPADLAELAKQTRFLLGRGFPLPLIRQMLRQTTTEV